MNLSAKTNKKPEQKARLSLRNSKWKSALPFLEEQVRADEQNFTQWNLLGDIQFRSGDLHAASASWQRAIDGYVQESLHENVLGIGRKMAKRCPEETEVHRLISEAYLGLEYYADAISAFRSFVKLARHATGVDKKAWFRKMMTCEIKHPHLLEELVQLQEDCNLEDVELERDLKAYVVRMQEHIESKESVEEDATFEPVAVALEQPLEDVNDGLMTIESDWSSGGLSFVKQDSLPHQQVNGSHESPAKVTEYELPEESSEEELPAGQGKDHYDLGVVYAEMKLWDAAITEFQTARRDRSIRSKATIELSHCFKNSNDPHRALRLLEEASEVAAGESEAQDELHYQMGVLNETLGNVDAAISCFDKVNDNSVHSEEAAVRASRLRS